MHVPVLDAQGCSDDPSLFLGNELQERLFGQREVDEELIHAEVVPRACRLGVRDERALSAQAKDDRSRQAVPRGWLVKAQWRDKLTCSRNKACKLSRHSR